MSSTHINFNDKYNRVVKLDRTGIYTTKTVSLSCEKEIYISTETVLRAITENVGPTNEIEIQARILNQSTWQTIETLTGNENKLIDISTWDQIRYNVTTLDNTASSKLVVSAFVDYGSNSENTTTEEDCDICDIIKSTSDIHFDEKITDETISALKAVRSTSPTNVELADSNTTEVDATVLGISTTGANIGNNITIITRGKISDASFTYPNGTPLYLDINGCITDQDPDSLGRDYRTQIGTSLGLGSIYVDIQEPIKLC